MTYTLWPTPHPPFTNAAAQPRVGNDTQHLLRNSAWNEAAKMSGQRGPECKFRHAFNFVWAFFIWLKAPNHVTRYYPTHTVVPLKLCRGRNARTTPQNIHECLPDHVMDGVGEAWNMPSWAVLAIFMLVLLVKEVCTLSYWKHSTV